MTFPCSFSAIWVSLHLELLWSSQSQSVSFLPNNALFQDTVWAATWLLVNIYIYKISLFTIDALHATQKEKPVWIFLSESQIWLKLYPLQAIRLPQLLYNCWCPSPWSLISVAFSDWFMQFIIKTVCLLIFSPNFQLCL